MREIIEVTQNLEQYIPQSPAPVQPFQTGDLVEFGNMLGQMGLGNLEVRGLIEEMTAIVNGAVMTAAPKIMDRVQRVHRERLSLLMNRVRLQPAIMGMISRDTVIALIQATMTETPRI